MNNPEINIKLSYIPGLRPVVLDELKKSNMKVLREVDDSIYLEFSIQTLQDVKKQRSVARAYLIVQNALYNPTYLSNHKSVLGNLVEHVVSCDSFKTFKITCAGSDSPEVRSIASYIEKTYGIQENDDADLKIHMIKPDDVWEIGVQITPRPLSVRDYKVVNMKGAMDPTIAYAVNSFCIQDSTKTYLNIFSGSATLLIEAAECYPHVEKLIGFDNDKSHLTLSIQNIKKAGFIKKIQVKECDIFNKPDLGTFDAVVSDVPFGMLVSKDQDLQKLYGVFVEYCEHVLNVGGRLVIYTSEFELMESIISQSQFKIVQSLQLTLSTNVGAYLKPKIIVCEFKDK